MYVNCILFHFLFYNILKISAFISLPSTVGANCNLHSMLALIKFITAQFVNF